MSVSFYCYVSVCGSCHHVWAQGTVPKNSSHGVNWPDIHVASRQFVSAHHGWHQVRHSSNVWESQVMPGREYSQGYGLGWDGWVKHMSNMSGQWGGHT